MIDVHLSSVGDFTLEDWIVQPRLNRISCDESTVTLEPKIMQVLVCLAQHAGDLVSRQDLIDTIWAAEFVSEKVLTRAIAELRRAFGDDARDPKYIETIHRRGYVLLVEPGAVTSEESSTPSFEKISGERFQPARGQAFDLRHIGIQSQTLERPRRPTAVGRTWRWVAVGFVTFAIAAIATWQLLPRIRAPVSAEETPRIVVLPFENLGFPEDEYFADGITEEITSRLAAVSGLQVISRSSAMRYKGRRLPVGQIGEELDVGFVLEGTIQWDRGDKGHGRVRITPQLIKVADDSHLWSERYDQVLEDIFAVQSDIAEHVVLRLEATILEPEKRFVEARPTNNMEAYQAYLFGVQNLWDSLEENWLRLAAEMLERAVDLDPEFALAHALLSEVHSCMYHFRYDFTSERLEMAKASVDRAMDLQVGLPEGHRALGWYYYLGYRDYDRALEEFSIAAKSLPNDYDLLWGIFAIYRRQGRWDEALQALDRWLSVDPNGHWARNESAVVHRMHRNWEVAEEDARRAITAAPNIPDAYYTGAWIYISRDGATARARRLLESAPSLDSTRHAYLSVKLDLLDRRPDSALTHLDEISIDPIEVDEWYRPRALLECFCFSQMGERERVERAGAAVARVLERSIEERPHDYRLYSALGHAYALLGRNEQAVRAGERSFELMPTSKDALVGPVLATELAKIYTRVGETDKALNLIEELLSTPSNLSVGLLRLDPAWDSLRDDPRFQALLEENHDTS